MKTVTFAAKALGLSVAFVLLVASAVRLALVLPM